VKNKNITCERWRGKRLSIVLSFLKSSNKINEAYQVHTKINKYKLEVL